MNSSFIDAVLAADIFLCKSAMARLRLCYLASLLSMRSISGGQRRRFVATEWVPFKVESETLNSKML